MTNSNPNYNQKRYRLHASLRKQGYKVVARQHLLIVPNELLNNLSKQAKRLKNEFNYQLQTSIV